MKSPKPRNKAQRKVDYKNYDAITMRRNYDTKLSATHYYEEKLSQEIISLNMTSRVSKIYIALFLFASVSFEYWI